MTIREAIIAAGRELGNEHGWLFESGGSEPSEDD